MSDFEKIPKHLRVIARRHLFGSMASFLNWEEGQQADSLAQVIHEVMAPSVEALLEVEWGGSCASYGLHCPCCRADPEYSAMEIDRAASIANHKDDCKLAFALAPYRTTEPASDG